MQFNKTVSKCKGELAQITMVDLPSAELQSYLGRIEKFQSIDQVTPVEESLNSIVFQTDPCLITNEITPV